MKSQYAYSGDNQIYDTSTGEILDKKELKLAAEIKIKETSRAITREMIDMGIYLDVRVVRDTFGEEYNSINIKENYEFNKIYRVELMKLFNEIQLDAISYAFLGRFTPCLHFPSNSLMLNGTHPSQVEMADAMGIGKTKLNEVLKQLEFYNIIKREKINGKLYIFFNPFLYSTGVVSLDTVRLFKESVFNPYKPTSEEVKNKEYKRVKKPKASVV